MMNINQKKMQALDLCKRGLFEEAEKIYKKILEKKMNDSEVLNNLGMINLQRGKLDNAEQYFEKNYLTNNDKSSLINLINIKIQKQNYDEAEVLNEKTEKDDGYLQRKINFMIGKKDFEGAYKLNNKINENNENLIKYKIITESYLLNKLNKHEDSYLFIKDVLTKKPELKRELNYNLGIVCIELNKLEEAEQIFQDNLDKNKNDNEALLNIGNINKKRRKFEAAENCFKEIIKNNKLNLKAHYNLAVLYFLTDKLEMAEQEFNECLKISPNNPEANYGLAGVNLKKKNFEMGWEYYKWRLLSDPDKSFGIDDSHIKELKNISKLLILYEQGIGDVIFYARFLPILEKEFSGEIIVFVEKRVSDLLNKVTKKIKYINNIENIGKFSDYVKINLGTLPKFYIKSICDISKIKNFKLNIINKKIENNVLKTNKNIGISWISKNKEWGNDKSLSTDDIKQILKQFSEFNFYNLQYGLSHNEIKKIKENNSNFIELADIDKTNDILELAILIQHLDLVITTSNVTAHISGALGKKTILLLPKSVGKLWYWVDEDEKSIWYKNTFIVKQEKDGCWKSVLNMLNQKLLDLI